MKQFSLINIDDHINNFEEIANQFTKLPLYLTGKDIDRWMDKTSLINRIQIH